MKRKSNTLKALFGSSLLVLALTGCGYQGEYRYDCQDPENWGAKECVPPVCEATGQCTKDLLGFDPLETDSSTIEPTTTTGDK